MPASALVPRRPSTHPRAGPPGRPYDSDARRRQDQAEPVVPRLPQEDGCVRAEEGGGGGGNKTGLSPPRGSRGACPPYCARTRRTKAHGRDWRGRGAQRDARRRVACAGAGLRLGPGSPSRHPLIGAGDKRLSAQAINVDLRRR